MSPIVIVALFMAGVFLLSSLGVIVIGAVVVTRYPEKDDPRRNDPRFVLPALLLAGLSSVCLLITLLAIVVGFLAAMF